MQANVLAELEYVEQRAVGAAATGEQRRERALAAVASHAAAAMSTLLHIGLINRVEDAAWRARLGRGPRRRESAREMITLEGAGTPTAEDQARSAYFACRDLGLTDVSMRRVAVRDRGRLEAVGRVELAQDV